MDVAVLHEGGECTLALDAPSTIQQIPDTLGITHRRSSRSASSPSCRIPP